MATPSLTDIRYYGRNFTDLKQSLVEFAKVYYPNSYTDFNEASPGMMFIEMAAYVGDVLNYYIDSQLKESLLLNASERKNVLAIAAAMGYRAKLAIPSVVDLDVYQLLPASGSGVSAAPDMRYALKVEPNMQVVGADNINFIVSNGFDFSQDTYDSPTTISVYQIDQVTGQPEYYLAKKRIQGISATTATSTFTVGPAAKFYKIQLPNTDGNLIGIQSIVDSDGNSWTEVDYLAQETVFEKVTNTAYNDPDSAVYSDETPYLLKLKKVPKRFITRVTPSGLEIQFGSGTSTTPDEELLPLQENLGLNLPTGIINNDVSYDPTNPVFTQTYGEAPANTTLTVTYLIGGGISSNVAANTVNSIVGVVTDNAALPPSTGTLNTQIINSLAVLNPNPASGGRSQEGIEEIRQNALATLTSQNRAVTREDYIIRALSLPSTYGSVAKVYIAADEQANFETVVGSDYIKNPLALNLYVLGYNAQKQLTELNAAVKNNLRTYLSQYKMLTDAINIKDGYYINIGVNFAVVATPQSNSNEVIIRAVEAMKNYFNIDLWQVNQPIYLTDIYNTLLQVPGVQNVSNVVIYNLNNTTQGYSPNQYDIGAATQNGIIYPSLDPSIFEVRYPNTDIKGAITTF